MWVQPHNKMYKNVQAKDNNLCNIMPVTQGLRKNPIFCGMHAIKLE